MQTYAFEYENYYQIIITDGTKENSYDFEFLKDQDLNYSIQIAQQLYNLYNNEKNIIPKSV